MSNVPKDIANVVAVDFANKAPVVDKELNGKKRALFSDWLTKGTVLVQFDARPPQVKVPPEFKDRGDLRLNFCHDFRIADFNYNDVSIWATLSFDSGEFFCVLPWSVVYGLQSEQLHQGAVWFESFPSDQNQLEVLGFSEEMCESWAQDTGDVSHIESDNVVKLDFTRTKD